jgi:hypothetical protein
LVKLITAAALDEAPKYSVKEVYEALMDARAWSLLVGPLQFALLNIYIIDDAGPIKFASIACSFN